MVSHSKFEIRYLLFGVFCFLALFSCARHAPYPTQKKLVWAVDATFADYQYALDIARMFERENPEAAVEVQYIPARYQEKIRLQISTKNPPDIIKIDNRYFPRFASLGLFYPLDSFITGEKYPFDRSLIHPRVLACTNYHGVQYGFPYAAGNFAVFYNRDLFDRYKVAYPTNDWTFANMVAKAESLTADRNGKRRWEPGYDGKNVLYGLETLRLPNESILYSCGADYTTPDGRVLTLNSPEGREAYQHYWDLLFKYKVMPTMLEGDLSTIESGVQFLAGLCAMSVAGPWMVTFYSHEKGLNYDVAWVPKIRQQVTVTSVVSYAVLKTCPYPELAWRLIRFRSSPLAQKMAFDRGLEFPMNKTAIAQVLQECRADSTPGRIHMENFIYPDSQAKPRTAAENYQEVYNAIYDARFYGGRDFELGQKTVPQLFADMETICRERRVFDFDFILNRSREGYR